MHVFAEQALTAAFKASFVHKHFKVRSLAQVELGISDMKQANYIGVLVKARRKFKDLKRCSTHGAWWHLLYQSLKRSLGICRDSEDAENSQRRPEPHGVVSRLRSSKCCELG